MSLRTEKKFKNVNLTLNDFLQSLRTERRRSSSYDYEPFVKAYVTAEKAKGKVNAIMVYSIGYIVDKDGAWAVMLNGTLVQRDGQQVIAEEIGEVSDQGYGTLIDMKHGALAFFFKHRNKFPKGAKWIHGKTEDVLNEIQFQSTPVRSGLHGLGNDDATGTIEEALEELRKMDPEAAAVEELRLIRAIGSKISEIQQHRDLIKRRDTLEAQKAALRKAGMDMDNPEILEMAAQLRPEIAKLTKMIKEKDNRSGFLHRIIALSKDPLFTIKNLVITFGPTGLIKATDLRGKQIINTEQEIAIAKEDILEEMKMMAAQLAQHDDVAQKIAGRYKVSERVARAALALSKKQLNAFHIFWAREKGREFALLGDKRFINEARMRFVIDTPLANLILKRYKEVKRDELLSVTPEQLDWARDVGSKLTNKKFIKKAKKKFDIDDHFANMILVKYQSLKARRRRRR